MAPCGSIQLGSRSPWPTRAVVCGGVGFGALWLDRGGLCLVDQQDPTSGLAEGMQWASRITSIALGFSMPALVGFGLDRWWGTTPAATIAGIFLGFASGMYQTLKIARELPADRGGQEERLVEPRESPKLAADH